MNFLRLIVIPLVLSAVPAGGEVGMKVDPLPCGIYDEQVKPLVEKNLETQNSDPSKYTMGATIKNGKKLSVVVKSIEIGMDGERNQVSVFLDDKPLARTSHQDVPVYLEVHIDNQKYRIVCVRVPEPENDQEIEKEKGKQTKLFVINK